MAPKASKEKGKGKAPAPLPSANWLALQKKVPKVLKPGVKLDSPRLMSNRPVKKRKIAIIDHDDGASEAGSNVFGGSLGMSGHGEQSTTYIRGDSSKTPTPIVTDPSPSSRKRNANGSESLDYLCNMVLGKVSYTDGQKEPGRYLALDCEMVGVGLDGSESSLARVSIVNFHGAIILDDFVRQRERVVDYRSHVSGVREQDMIKAKPFLEVQKKVAELLEDRILVGHAVQNDLKALLLSQPRPLTRDTQLCAGKAKLLKTKYPALRKLVQQELGIAIQAGEHSSVTDARATMALYRLHRKKWDGFYPRPPSISNTSSGHSKSKKRKAPEDDEEDEDPTAFASTPKGTGRTRDEFPGGGRRGVSSGLTTIIKSPGIVEKGPQGKHGRTASGGAKEKWWKTLSAPSRGSKGSIRLKA